MNGRDKHSNVYACAGESETHITPSQRDGECHSSTETAEIGHTCHTHANTKGDKPYIKGIEGAHRDQRSHTGHTWSEGNTHTPQPCTPYSVTKNEKHYDTPKN